MANRHLARTIAMQSLFEWDFNHRSQKLQPLIERNLKEFAPGLDDNDFTQNLVRGITKNLSEIDRLIEKYAPEWPIEQITIIDRNILRLGIYELKFGQETPPKVAINEAIELAKTYGGSSSGKFVNGVLGTIYKEMEEKGERISTIQGVKLKTKDENLGAKEISAGGVVYRREGRKLWFVLIKDAYDKWTFPKGHKDEKEDLKEAAKREIEEEIGIKNLEIKDEIGSIDIEVHMPQKEPIPKKVYYFLMETKDLNLNVKPTHEVKEGKWVEKENVLDILDYENSKEIFLKAVKILSEI